jgi:Tol biopolymer transport system component
MKKSTNKTLILTVIFVVFILAIGIIMSKNVATTPASVSDNNTSSDQSVSDTKENAINGTIIYMIKSSDANEIYKLSTNGDAKIVYTDKDETQKIKNAVSVTSQGKVLALFADQNQEFGGALYLIDTNIPGQKDLLIDQFASTQAPVISPNGKKIAYIVFSNVEIDYGFSLYVMNNDGTNKQKISSDAVGIKILSWNPENNKIAYLKGDTSKESKVFVADLSGNESELTSFKEKVYSLNWTDGIMALCKGSQDNTEINKSEVYTMDVNGKNLKRITNNDKHDNFAFNSPNNNALVYLDVNYDKNVDLNKSGDVNLINLSDNNIKKIGEANYIIGWINN